MNKLLTGRNKEILEHYQKFWGYPREIFDFDVKEYTDSPHLIYIAEFPPNSDGEDWVYATVGNYNVDLSGRIKNEERSRKLEFFLYSNLPNPEIAKFLASLCVYPAVNKTYFSVGDTVRGETSILEGSALTDVLLTYPYFEERDFGIIHHTDNSHTLMIWLIPLYQTERQFVHESSWDALEELFRKNATDTSDFFRESVV